MIKEDSKKTTWVKSQQKNRIYIHLGMVKLMDKLELLLMIMVIIRFLKHY